MEHLQSIVYIILATLPFWAAWLLGILLTNNLYTPMNWGGQPAFVNWTEHKDDGLMVYSFICGQVDVFVVLIISNFDEPVPSLHKVA